jgi:hypothetical protein
MDISDIVEILKGGGTPALILCAIFIYRVESRLARIEKAFDMLVSQLLPKVIQQTLEKSS